MLGEFIEEEFSDLSRSVVWELDPFSPLRSKLERARQYTRTFFNSSLSPGTLGPEGATMQDVTHTTFADDTFDLIISSDVLEHVPDVEAAFEEFRRVLKPSGVCIFTVPPSEKTIRRAYVKGDGTVEHLVEPEYHSDPLNSGGILAFWSFGLDMPNHFRDTGLEFKVIKGPEGISDRIIWKAQRRA